MPIAEEAAPSADAITIAETLDLLGGRFAAVADAVERRGFALWVGSGISRDRAPNVGEMLARALEHLRGRADLLNATCKFKNALIQALTLSGLDAARRATLALDTPFADWPEKNEIVGGLWDRYAEVLDIRVQGEAPDYMLWNAVDVRNTYGVINDPDCEHVCIAILVMEGAIADIPSANWDGLIEAALQRLSGALNLLQVIVDPIHLRDPAARTRLIKFHGCAVHCVQDPGTYRKCLIATRPQITFWPHDPALTALRDILTTVATNSRTLMVGLSLQDTNLQDLFARARAAHPWPWPSGPQAQGHVFCANALGGHQVNMLRVVYGAAYDQNQAAIEAAALLQAYGKPVLLALVLHLISAKLSWLLKRALLGRPLAATQADLLAGLAHVRDRVATLADGNRLEFVKSFVQTWSRAISLFRQGEPLTAGSEKYEAISPLAIQEMGADANVAASGLPEMSVAVALLGRGEAADKWRLSVAIAPTIANGAIEATGTWEGANATEIYFASSAAVALKLIGQGALANGNAVVIHSEDAWHQMNEAGNGGKRYSRAAPGRTGRPSVRHVSMGHLLQNAADCATLEQRFAEEVMV